MAKIPGPAVHGTHYHDSPDEYLQILASGMNRDGTPLEAWTPIPSSFQAASSLSSAIPLPVIPSSAKRAVVQPHVANVYYRDDGGAPTTTNGHELEAGGLYAFTGNLSGLRFIQKSAGATLGVSYYSD